MSIKPTEEQQLVIDAREGAYCVAALAGSGKTFCIKERVANLIRIGVHSFRILALTFTTKAAKEMSNRITKELGQHRVTICTFHSLAYKAFVKHHDKMGYKNGFEVVNNKYIKNRVIILYNKHFGTVDKETIKEISKFVDDIGEMKRNYRTPDYYFDHHWLKVYSMVSDDLKKDGKVTFDDLLYEVCKFFDEIPRYRDEFRKNFKYILVDESQDTNRVQFYLLNSINHTDNIMIIGDVNQGIFRFQDATAENIFDFNKKLNPKLLYLSTNFRSTQEIVDASNCILDYSLYNEKYRKKSVASKGSSGQKPFFKMYQDVNEQALGCAQQIQDFVKNAGHNYQDFTILYRNNSHSIYFEREFIRRKMPFIVKGGSFINRKEIQLLLACLKLGDKKYENELLSNYVTISNCFNNNVAESTLQLVFSFDKTKSFDEIVRSDVKIQGIGPKRKKALLDLVDFNDKVKVLSDIKGDIEIYKNKSFIDNLADEVMDVMSYSAEEKDELDLKRDSLNIFNELWSEYFFSNKEDKTLSGFMTDFVLQFSVEGDDGNKKEKEDLSIILSTVHSYKGLERLTVFVVNLKDGMFIQNPNECSDDEYQDCINLFYVACSRAKNMMYLSSPLESFTWFYPGNTWSLLKMFLDTGLIKGLDQHRELIERDTGFIDSNVRIAM